MSKLIEDGLEAIFNPLRQQMAYRDPKTSQLDAKVIQAKISAALKGYPEWAAKVRQADPNYMAAQKQDEPSSQPASQPAAQPTPKVQQRQAQQTTVQQRRVPTGTQLPTPNLQAAPTELPGYADRRKAAAQAAQASMRPGRPPQGNYTSSTADIIRKRQAQGMTESRFDDLYTLLESALFEQTVTDPGSFTNYIDQVIQFNLNEVPELKQIATTIDQEFASGKSDMAYKNAAKLLDYIYKQKSMGRSRGSISSGVGQSSVGSTHLDRVVSAMNSNYYNADELNNLILNVLTYMKRKYPSDYNEIVKDIRSSVANFQAQAKK